MILFQLLHFLLAFYNTLHICNIFLSYWQLYLIIVNNKGLKYKRDMSIRTSKMTFEGQPENVIFFMRNRCARISVV